VQSRIWRGGILNEILRSPYLRDRYVLCSKGRRFMKTRFYRNLGFWWDYSRFAAASYAITDKLLHNYFETNWIISASRNKIYKCQLQVLMLRVAILFTQKAYLIGSTVINYRHLRKMFKKV